MKSFISRHFYKILYILVCLVIAISVFRFEYRVFSDRKNHAHSPKIKITGTVASVPSHSDDFVSFVMKPEDSLSVKELVYVSIDHAKSLELCIGDTIALTGILSSPDGALNPGGFDFAAYLKSKGASLSIKSDISAVHMHKKGIFHPVYKLRDEITSKITRYLPPDEAALANALVTGSKEIISDENALSYRKSGIYHIVSVSGMHLNILIILLSVFYMKLNSSRRKKAILSFVITLMGCLFMFVFTGFGVSVERAAFMALISCVAALSMREHSPLSSLFIVLAFMLISAPYFYCDASFCLSFSATAGVFLGILFIEKIKITRFRFLVDSIIISLCTSLTTFPFVIYFFGGVSLVSPLTNLIILGFVPILMGLCFFFALICTFCPEFILSFTANMITGVAYSVNTISDFFANFPFSYIYVNGKTFIYLILLCIVIIALVKFKKRGIRIAIAALVIIANIFTLSYNKIAQKTDVVFLNAGQGDCSLIRSSDGFSVMIDCGSESKGDFGKSDAVPYLRNQGISEIDLMIITHFHEDHANGVVSLMEEGYVKKLVLPDRPLENDEINLAESIYKAAVINNIPVSHVSKGDVISYGKHRLDILSPEKADYPNANSGSMVIRYTFLKSSVLFCGDIDAQTQYNLMDTLSRCDIVKIAHHGAKSQMSHKFASKTDSSYAVVSCAKNNKYSHPDQDTLTAYKNSVILRTDVINSPISFIINSKGVKLKNARHQK